MHRLSEAGRGSFDGVCELFEMRGADMLTWVRPSGEDLVGATLGVASMFLGVAAGGRRSKLAVAGVAGAVAIVCAAVATLVWPGGWKTAIGVVIANEVFFGYTYWRTRIVSLSPYRVKAFDRWVLVAWFAFWGLFVAGVMLWVSLAPTLVDHG